MERRNFNTRANAKRKESEQANFKRMRQEVFRFMDLPAELRNHVYMYANEYSDRCFPPIVQKVRSDTTKPSSRSKSNPVSIPHIGLTQACSQIRSEFRPAWLSTHQIPLHAVHRYIKAFYPRLDDDMPKEIRERLTAQSSPCGPLRVTYHHTEPTHPGLGDMNIMGLLRHVAHNPTFTVTVTSTLDKPFGIAASIQTIISNKSKKWIKAIKAGKISQVLLRLSEGECCMRIVYKVLHAPWWMGVRFFESRTDWHEDRDQFQDIMGLSKIGRPWWISYGLDYC
ncbi:hypothetical protein ACEQ8H_004946 [Pleosporales sp. CAS-2024a]